MLPEVEEYLKATDVSDEEIIKAQDDLIAQYRDNHGVREWSRSTYDDLRYAMNDIACTITSRHEEEAWQKLQNSDDKLVKYIASNHRRYRDHAIEVLKILPATRNQLEELAIKNGWCSEWDHFVSRAERDGVVEPLMEQTTAVTNLLDWFRDNVDGGVYSKRALLSFVRRIVDEAVTKTTTGTAVTNAGVTAGNTTTVAV